MSRQLFPVTMTQKDGVDTYAFDVMAKDFDDAKVRAREYAILLGIDPHQLTISEPQRDANDMLDDLRRVVLTNSALHKSLAWSYAKELDQYLTAGGELPDAWTTTREDV